MHLRSLRFTVVFAALVAALAVLGAVSAAGVTGPAFYVDGTVYRTVGTPSNFTDTGAPDHTYDIIYAFPNGTQTINVAEAAPGDRDFNGGRWQVHALAFSNYAGALADLEVNLNGNLVLDSAEEVEAAIMGGYATDGGVVASFECPVIKMPAGHS